MAERILLVDDDPDILEFLSYNLKREGYEVECCNNGMDALKIVSKFIPALILLDIMMPDLDGIETCIELRKLPALKDTVIAFLTARNEDYSQVAGFEAGADDYICKPIRPRVLISRVKALLKRRRKDNLRTISFNGIKLDREKYLVFKNDIAMELPKKEFELLSLLISIPGKVFTREYILDKVWGTDVVVGDRTIDVHVRRLREKFGEGCIKTVKGIGYKYME